MIYRVIGIFEDDLGRWTEADRSAPLSIVP